MPHHPPKLELLKQQASEMGLSRDRVREFGSLTRRETWEKAIAFSQATNRECDQWNELENVDNVIHAEPPDTRISSILNFPQLIALSLVAAGFFPLIVPALRGVPSPLPIRITIQIGAK